MNMSTITRCNRRTMHMSVACLERFNYNRSAQGIWTTGHEIPRGMLSAERKASLEVFIGDRDRDVYVVYSYFTPIAAYVEGLGWWTNEDKYSPTTSNHQSMTQRGIRTFLEG